MDFNPDKSKRLNMTDLGTRQTASLWRPLRSPTFRNLLVADIASDVGTFMQSVGAAWMMCR
jgi:Transmembrane secretion effector